ncbi:hypothetical protein BROUX41_005606 [Berkeleyomyces rouxiae]|uniref:uncharacterized protein n=1 Tax=Berkeleyomyces rouxiae TaxID=2035830 RepID=UPI003B7D506E
MEFSGPLRRVESSRNDASGQLPVFSFSADETFVTLRYVYPCLVYAYFMLSMIVSILFLHNLRASVLKKPDSFRTPWLLRFMHLSSCSYLVQLLAIFTRSFYEREWLGREDEVVNAAACMLLYSIQSMCISDNSFPVWYPYYGSWIIGVVCEPCLVLLWAFTTRPFDLNSFYDILALALYGLRSLFYLAALIAYAVNKRRSSPKAMLDEEQRPLLANSEACIGIEQQQPLLPRSNPSNVRPDAVSSQASSSYGSTAQSNSSTGSPAESQRNGDNDSDDESGSDDYDTLMKKKEHELQKKLIDEGNWFVYLKRYRVLLPYVWPARNYKLQLFIALIGLCVLADNALNLLLPRQLGLIMDSLTGVVDATVWSQLAVFALLRALGSECGISFVQEWLLFPITNYSKENLNRAAFDHVLGLSADFHDSKSTSDTFMAIRGGEKFSSLVETVLFSGVSKIFDLFIAIIYLTSTFGPYEGLITITTGTLYLFLSASLLVKTRQAKRLYVDALCDETKNICDSVEGWPTVVSFNQTRYESKRYSASLLNLFEQMKGYNFHWFGTRALQSLSLLTGLLAGCCLAVVRIQNGQATPGQFAMLLMYWNQLSTPLMNLTYIGKQISGVMIDAERVLDLLNTKPTVVSQPGACPLRLTRGDVEFNGIQFGYTEKKDAIDGLSFFVHGGQTVAFVGASGAGKSTILKLMSRLYDPRTGSILIDNQNIRDVDIYSLRDRIGHVPQTPVLFNDTILNNIRYARMSASDDEVHEACKAACIHEQILGFAHGYETKVGERGVKLSGGELQRIAIARAILKRPDIVLLDEATSAVDTDTEQKIQMSLKNLTENRTTFIVAHRLSTIMNADRIIVIGDGKILEMGDHESLLKVRGKYHNLWSKQVFFKTKKKENTEESEDSHILVDDASVQRTNLEHSQPASSMATPAINPEDDTLHSTDEGKGVISTATSISTSTGIMNIKASMATPVQRLSSP